MRFAARLLWVCLMGCLPMIACNEVTTPGTVSLFVQLSTEVEPLCDPPCTLTALPDVQVCETGTANCVVTDAMGEAVLDLPANEEVSWTAEKEGYEPRLYLDVTDASFVSERRHKLRVHQRAAVWHEHLMADYPMQGVGRVSIKLNPAFEGATLDLIEATGELWYFTSPCEFPACADLSLEATTSVGVGGFLRVAPGDFQIEIGGTARDCFASQAWPGDAENRIRFPVRDGHVTEATANCALP